MSGKAKGSGAPAAGSLDDTACANTDRELYREPPGDYYASSIHVTESGALGINVGGFVAVLSLRQWHRLAWTDPDQRGARGPYPLPEPGKATAQPAPPEALPVVPSVPPDARVKELLEALRAFIEWDDADKSDPDAETWPLLHKALARTRSLLGASDPAEGK